MKWVKFDPDAWLAGTRGLTGRYEKGVYIDFIMLLYSRGEPDIEPDDTRIAGMLNLDIRRWVATKLSLMQKGKLFISPRTGRLSAKRVEAECNRQLLQSEVGSIFAKKRWKINETSMPPRKERKNLWERVRADPHTARGNGIPPAASSSPDQSSAAPNRPNGHRSPRQPQPLTPSPHLLAAMQHKAAPQGQNS